MSKITATTTAILILGLSTLFASSSQAADRDLGMSQAKIWFLVDAGFMDEQEAFLLLDMRQFQQQSTKTAATTNPSNTTGLAGLDLGSGRIRSLAGLDLGSGR